MAFFTSQGIRTKRTTSVNSTDQKADEEGKRKGSKPQDFQEVDMPLFRVESAEESYEFQEQTGQGYGSDQSTSLGLLFPSFPSFLSLV